MMSSLADLPTVLNDPFTSYLLHTHPNTFALAPTSDIPPHLHYTSVLRAYLAKNDPSDNTNFSEDSDLPPHIAHLIASIRRVQLPRNPVDMPHIDTDDAQRRYPRLSQGMSPKKAHEVSRMAAYILALVRANGLPTEAPEHGSGSGYSGYQRLHIVDVGAGQGYLTRALRALLPHARILALDADQAQSAGAIKWEERLFGKADHENRSGKGKAGIEHRTVLIGAESDPEEQRLRKVISEWVQDGLAEPLDGSESHPRERAPVLFVALHACGSLTPALLRAFIAASKPCPNETSVWRPAGAVAVGCCYNLMNPKDFPLSSTLCTHKPVIDLPPAAFHLAAQIPGTWLASGKDPNGRPNDPLHDVVDGEFHVTPAVALAIRKVAWRALLERVLATSRPMTAEELCEAQVSETGGVQPGASKPPRNEPEDDGVDNNGAPSTSTSKKATKRTKKSKKEAKEKKPSATVPARWERRPENWVPDPVEESSSAPDVLLPSTTSAPTKSDDDQEPAVRSTDTQRARTDAQPSRPEDHSAPSSGMGATPALRRLGRLRDGAYTADWDSFLREAGARMGVVFEGSPAEEEERTVLERQLETLHVMRCIVGPVVESAILRDRLEWVCEALSPLRHPADEPLSLQKMELVNLFDQETGSGRNVAIVISPCIPCIPM